jgi:di/tricarboxylate transporter
MIVGGCVRLDSIYRIISWKTVVLITGMLPLATALTKTGATDLMAKELVAALGSLGPIAMLAVVFLVTALVGLFVSNSATAVLIGPIAIDAAPNSAHFLICVCDHCVDRLLRSFRDSPFRLR